MGHPDLEVERARLEFARKCLEEMRSRTLAMADREELLAATEPDVEAVRYQLRKRAETLVAEGATLCFGRIDEERGDTWYVGRRHIDDPDGEPVVIDWRAPVAVPFYRATGADPLGLAGRRRYTFVHIGGMSELGDIYEEDFTDPDSLAGASGVPDPLLAELRRERTGQMRDIVATIQAEQDVVIRAPLHECLVVQGGPGTGKTAVGLHRAAFILYEHREQLARSGVLVIGPNSIFLDYIAQVLPSLGETSVTQATLDGLFGLRFRIGIDDPPARRALLGDPRWVGTISRAADAVIAPPAELTVRFRGRRVAIDAGTVAALLRDARARDTARRSQREWFRARIVREAYDRWTGGELLATSLDEFSAEVLAHKGSRAALDSAWRSLGAVALVRSLLTTKHALARAGGFDADERRVIGRRRFREGTAELWSAAELPLLDEAEAQLTGAIRVYGHVVVDEAQDHSPMALRVIGRRAARGSMTVLGDLAQTTGVAGTSDWREALVHLGAPPGARQVELTIGYRLPRAILDHANELLPVAAPHVTPARSARDEGDPPELLEAESIVDTAVARAHELRAEHATTAVIAPREHHAALRAGLGFIIDDSIAQPLSLLSPELAKGLEFDSVVVVDPDAILAVEPHGARLLYVALTRAVQHLTVVRGVNRPR